MTPDDVIDILTAVAITDRRTVAGNEVIMWHKILGHLPKDLALQAVVDHFREQPGVWLEPGHIVAGVCAIQRDRYERQSLDEIEARNDRLDERLAPRIIEFAEAWSVDAQPRRQFVRASTGELPTPLTVACRWCNASPGNPCTIPNTREPLRREPRYHPARIQAAAAGHEHDTAIPLCTQCGTRPLITPQAEERTICDECHNANPKPKPKPERSNA